jgi:hypothetical protein
MFSTDAGTPAAGDGRPPGEAKPRRGLRDHPAGKLLLLGLVLVAALLVARTCGSADKNVSQEEAFEIAKANADFEPCPELQCMRIRYVQRGIPVRGFWLVGLTDTLDAEAETARTQNFLIDVSTGEVVPP